VDPTSSNPVTRAMFISIDGGDGTGKSTQAALLCEWLRARGHNVVACRDPGSTPLGEAVRGAGRRSPKDRVLP
jgi:dTMP kinase